MTMPDDIKAHNRMVIEDFRARGGAPDGRRLLLLTTIGARTGRKHTTPMMFIPDGDRLLVLPSNAGAPRHPDWYHNLVANPDVTVEVTGDTYPARAIVTTGEERERLFSEVAAKYPFFHDHQAKITRQIPVVVLVRR
jgi:deazaflavin-dependent oxidoreductase (nitroreductase family)